MSSERSIVAVAAAGILILLATSAEATEQVDEERPVLAAPAAPAAPAPTAPAPAPTAPTEARLAQAQVTIARGKALFGAHNYDAAVAEFLRAYELLEGHPRQYIVLHNLAVCHERTFRYDLALGYYEDYLRQAPASEADRSEVIAVVRTLHSLLAGLQIESPVRAEVWVDDRRVGTAPGHVLIPSGRHVVELRAEHYQTERREVQIGSGQQQRIRFELERMSTYRGPDRGYFWASVGLTGAAVVAGAVFGVLSLSASDDGQEKAALLLDSRNEAERARHFSRAADGSFAGAVVFGVTSTILYFVTDWSPNEEHRSSTLDVQTTRRRLSLAVGPGGVIEASFGGRF